MPSRKENNEATPGLNRAQSRQLETGTGPGAAGPGDRGQAATGTGLLSPVMKMFTTV